MKLDVYLDELNRSACCQSVLKIEFLPTLVNFFKPSKTHPPPRPPARHSNPEGPLQTPAVRRTWRSLVSKSLK